MRFAKLLSLLSLATAACIPVAPSETLLSPSVMMTAEPTILFYTPTSIAHDTEYPTVAALRQAVILPRDRVDLARRFLGLRDVPPAPTTANPRQVGEQEAFWVTDSAADRVTQVTATLRAVGEHVYVWVDNRVQVDSGAAESLVRVFDEQIYDAVRELWGSEPTPGVDGDARVYVVFAYDLAPGVGGYFASDHLYPSVILPTSNQHEMFFFNLNTATEAIDNMGVRSILGHEFQHMIRAKVDDNEDTWMDEGFSMFTELSLGYPNPVSAASIFLATPRTQLNAWSEDGARAPHYGAAMLFFAYYFERYGREGLRALSDEPTSGITAVENVLGIEEARDLLADWALANYFMLPDTGYGYYILPAGMPGATPLAVVNAYPFASTTTGVQYAADYYPLTHIGGAQTLEISLEMPRTTPLLDTTFEAGDWTMYSSKADNSDTTLTRAFDLTGVSSATLNYRVWYHLENLWDYGYIAVSADDGATWQTLATAHTTTENPHGNAYGAGYTGQSFVWWDESVSLDAFAGQEILVRFEVITDDSISQAGMALDDIRIPELNYSEDFEGGDGGWQAQGWLRTDNRLPQRAWVQVAQQVGDEVEVRRWLFPDEGTAWSVPLVEGASQVVLVVLPFAPVTVVPVGYTVGVVGN
jgi:hypothetical protein